MTVTQYADWLNIGDDKLFFWHHLPTEHFKNTAVIILGPIGPEYMPCHRSIRLLANKIAQEGFNCIRYDPIGMGNSSGHLDDSLIWSKWIKSPHHIANYLKEKFNVDSVILIGVRSGCLVLAQTKININIDALVFWHPQTSGSKYLRGIQLLDSVLYQNTSSSNNTTLEGGGYPFTKELQCSIKKININSIEVQNTPNALIINNTTIDNKSNLSEILLAANAKVEAVSLDGLDDMVKQVTLSKIPHSNIKHITNWLAKINSSERNNSIENIIPDNNYISSNFIESTITIETDKAIFGILTKPNNKSNNKIVIFPNTGAAHHAGPNRIHVDASRILAEKGISTLRFDLSNLGESTDSYDIDPPEEFPATAAIDINTVINYAHTKLGFKKIILCGISAGAHNVFHAALEASSNEIKTLILINPDTFYWSPNHSAHLENTTKTEVDQVYYQKQIFNLNKWLKLLSSPKKLLNTSLFLIRLVYKKMKKILVKLLRFINIRILSILEKDISKLGERGINIVLIYSKGDPGYNILMSQASYTLNQLKKDKRFSSIRINNGDHTFSSIDSRKELYKALTTVTS